ncbi:unnamed protein product [Leptidea sinapis]|uniref:Uncharacterized protein n=1 Tax=Leptidea sinapis TaxID=189913 RepID=A0A5E4Q2Z6_9NEOP|nr:unnamed protein product [Leptidea sinapis]
MDPIKAFIVKLETPYYTEPSSSIIIYLYLDWRHLQKGMKMTGDRMSRNKDKHEGASARTYHIMSEAERASGRRGGWNTLEVTLVYLGYS